MFLGHEGNLKNSAVLLSWALAAVATGTGFWLVQQEGDLSPSDRGYLIAAATLTAIALLLLTTIATDYLVDLINFSEYHIHAIGLAWSLLVAATGIWWWVFNTRLVDRNDQYLLTSASTATIAVAFLTGAFMLEREDHIPMMDKIEKGMGRAFGKVLPSSKRSPKKHSPKRSPSRKNRK